MKIVIDLSDDKVRTKMVMLYLESLGFSGKVNMSHSFIEDKYSNKKYYDKITANISTEDK